MGLGGVSPPMPRHKAGIVLKTSAATFIGAFFHHGIRQILSICLKFNKLVFSALDIFDFCRIQF